LPHPSNAHYLGLQVVRKNIAVFPQHEIKAALERLRYHHPVLQL